MGERLVYASFTAPAKTTTHPTTRSVMVDAEDPGCNSKILTQPRNQRSSQLVSLSLKPSSRITTPETIKDKPMKSNSLRCCLNGLP
jgi:hypothetical protein